MRTRTFAAALLILSSIALKAPLADAAGETISGHVIDSVTGAAPAPTAFATVVLEDAYGGFVDSAAVQLDGGYTIGPPGPGTYYARLVSPAYRTTYAPSTRDRSSATPIVVGFGDVVAGIDITSDPNGTLTGTLTGPGGTLVAGLLTVYDATDNTLLAGYSVDGEFSISAPSGDLKVMAQADGLLREFYPNVGSIDQADPVAVIPATPTSLGTIALGVTGSIAGVVTDDNGAPVAGVNVTAFGSDVLFATTDASGAYRIDGAASPAWCLNFTPPTDRSELVPMTYPRFVQNGSMACSLGTVWVVGDTPTTADQTLSTGGSISGRVTDTDGSPIAGASVEDSLDTIVGPHTVSTTTDANGEYSFTGLAPFPGSRDFGGPGVHTVRITTPDSRSTTLGPFDIYGGTNIVGADAVFQQPIMGTARLYLGGLPYTAGFAQGPGICVAPGVFGVGSLFCPSGPIFITAIAQPDGSYIVGPFQPGSYTARAVSVFGGPNGTATTFTVDEGDSVACDLPYDEPPVCTVTHGGPPPVGDDDGVPTGVENAAPNGGDGNGDGTADGTQDNVASTTDPTGGYATIAAPTGQTVSDVTVVAPASLPAPPTGVRPETGIISYSVAVPTGATTTVSLFVDDPAGSVNSFWKYQNGGWVNATSLATFTALGDGRTKITVSLTDGGFGDADGVANGVIVDPAMAAHYTPFVFDGFRPPVAVGSNATKAGSTVPLKWRLTNADGSVVSDPASIVAVQVLPGVCAGPAVASSTPAASVGAVAYQGNGNWQFNWKTAKTWRGCAVLAVVLSDGTTHTANFTFK